LLWGEPGRRLVWGVVFFGGLLKSWRIVEVVPRHEFSGSTDLDSRAVLTWELGSPVVIQCSSSASMCLSATDPAAVGAECTIPFFESTLGLGLAGGASGEPGRTGALKREKDSVV